MVHLTCAAHNEVSISSVGVAPIEGAPALLTEFPVLLTIETHGQEWLPLRLSIEEALAVGGELVGAAMKARGR